MRTPRRTASRSSSRDRHSSRDSSRPRCVTIQCGMRCSAGGGSKQNSRPVSFRGRRASRNERLSEKKRARLLTDKTRAFRECAHEARGVDGGPATEIFAGIDVRFLLSSQLGVRFQSTRFGRWRVPTYSSGLRPALSRTRSIVHPRAASYTRHEPTLTHQT